MAKATSNEGSYNKIGNRKQNKPRNMREEILISAINRYATWPASYALIMQSSWYSGLLALKKAKWDVYQNTRHNGLFTSSLMRLCIFACVWSTVMQLCITPKKQPIQIAFSRIVFLSAIFSSSSSTTFSSSSLPLLFPELRSLIAALWLRSSTVI